jgi:hypothetical protein
MKMESSTDTEAAILLLAAAPYLMAGAAEVVGGATGAAWPWLIAYACILAGLGVGWLRWFPRWAYAFAGSALALTVLLLTQPASLSGAPPAWLVCLPGVTLTITALLATRSALPLLKVVQDLGRDWTLVSFLLYALMPIATWLALNGVTPALSAVGGALSCLILGAGAAAYVRRKNKRLRALALLLGMTLAWLVSGIVLLIYWPGKPQVGTSTLATLQGVAAGIALTWLVLAALIFFPGLFAAITGIYRKILGDLG